MRIVSQKGRLFVLVLTIALAGVHFGFAAGSAETERDLDTWMQEVGVGPYQAPDEDWDAVYAEAQQEPTLTVMMTTSRVDQTMEPFRERYPGVDVESVHIAAGSAHQRLTREWEAGVFSYDVLHLAGFHHYRNIAGEAMVNFIPAEYAARMQERHQDPLAYRVLSYGWAYNPVNFPEGAPFESLWDLTTEEWRGRVIITDPSDGGNALDKFGTIIQHADLMAEEYERVFGEQISLREQDAGWEWFRRLLENDPQVIGDNRQRVEAIDASNGPLVGYMDYDRLRWAYRDPGYNFAFAFNLSPFDAVNILPIVQMGAFTQSPNAAKLFIRYMLTEEGGAPWYGQGNPPLYSGWEPDEDWVAEWFDLEAVEHDGDWLLANQNAVIDAWDRWR